MNSLINNTSLLVFRRLIKLIIPIYSLFILGCSSNSKFKEVELNYYSNPILAGFYPDPSICKAGDNYFLVTSSFSYFPGIPIFKSQDLINWTQIGHVMARPEQLDTKGQRISRGLFAPSIAYYEGKYYVICTQVDKGGNFIVTATDPAGPWSDPVFLPEVNGIDPSLLFDDSKLYVVYNSIPPDNKSLYDGHRTIRMYELDKDNFSVKSEQYLLINGGTDLSKEPVWIEAPHLYKINGLYYLMCAEGGTAYNHSEVIFRSSKVTGPYEPWDRNPILTQRQLDPKRPYPVTTAGHADMVQMDNGDWWAVFLACRPYGDNFYNIGRETFLAPVAWKEGWPVINPDFEEIQYAYPTPLGNAVDKTKFQYSGNFNFTDEFDSLKLPFHYVFLRTPSSKWYELANGQLTMQLRSETASELSNPSFIGHRQQHHKGSATIKVDFKATADNEKAGLLAFQGENNFYFLAKSIEDNGPVVQLFQSAPDSVILLASQEIKESEPLQLKIGFDNNLYSFSYANSGGSWHLLKDSVDGTFLSTRVAGGFVGTVIGMYATSNGQLSKNTAHFDWYKYMGNDDVYNLE